jgi:hypothetical protein
MTTGRDHTAEPTVHEAVGLFDDPEKLHAAISELVRAGVDRADISLLARDEEAERALERESTKDLAEDPGAPRESPITDTDVRQGRTLATSLGAVIAAFAASGVTVLTGGAAAAAIAAAVAAGGGIGFVGAALGKVAGEERARFLREQIDRGGILLWVRIKDSNAERRIQEILARHGAAAVHAHDNPAYPAAG